MYHVLILVVNFNPSNIKVLIQLLLYMVHKDHVIDSTRTLSMNIRLYDYEHNDIHPFYHDIYIFSKSMKFFRYHAF